VSDESKDDGFLEVVPSLFMKTGQGSDFKKIFNM
jgi:hypothetical protein